MYSTLLAIVLILLSSQTNVPKEQDTQLAEYSYDSDGTQVAPIAIIRRGKLLDPILYREPENDAKVLPFLNLHYAKGSKFSVYKTGQRLGSVQLAGQTGGCYSDFTQRAKPVEKLVVEAPFYSLAISKDIVGSHTHLKRDPTKDEQSAFIEASRALISTAYSSVTSKTRSKVHKVIWTTGSTSGSPLLLGSISFIKEKNELWLFAILEQTDSKWRPAISEIHRIHDLEDRKDAIEENYLDQLDIDGDGIDEFFSTSTYYEGISYSAYGIRDGKWTKIFKGGYSGC
jgi:hypothetical protein